MGWVTRRERGITRLSKQWGCATSVGGGGRRSLVPRARLVSPSTPLKADRACRCSSSWMITSRRTVRSHCCFVLPYGSRWLFRGVRSCAIRTRVERSSESWRLVESVIHGLDSALRSGQQLQSTTVVERLKFFVVDRTDLPLWPDETIRRVVRGKHGCFVRNCCVYFSCVLGGRKLASSPVARFVRCVSSWVVYSSSVLAFERSENSQPVHHSEEYNLSGRLKRRESSRYLAVCDQRTEEGRKFPRTASSCLEATEGSERRAVGRLVVHRSVHRSILRKYGSICRDQGSFPRVPSTLIFLALARLDWIATEPECFSCVSDSSVRSDLNSSCDVPRPRRLRLPSCKYPSRILSAWSVRARNSIKSREVPALFQRVNDE